MKIIYIHKCSCSNVYVHIYTYNSIAWYSLLGTEMCSDILSYDKCFSHELTSFRYSTNVLKINIKASTSRIMKNNKHNNSIKTFKSNPT